MAEMSRTVPRPNIDIGIRPMIPATENRQAPGISKISAYGRSGRVSRPAGERLAGSPASSRSVIGRNSPRLIIYRISSRDFGAGRAQRMAAGHGWLDGTMPAYDAFLLVSFGGPEGPDEVMPFLENVTR